MKVAIDPRSILTNKIKYLKIDDSMVKMYEQYLEMLNKEGKTPSQFDLFVAGWIFANPTVRDKFVALRIKDSVYRIPKHREN